MNAIKKYLELANETLHEAKLMFDNSHYRATVSRAYYASFYAIHAALESIQIVTKTHKGALMMFSKHFIKSELFPRQFGKFLQNNLEQRLVGDYEIGFRANVTDAQSAIDNATTIILGITDFLQKSNKLEP